MPRMLAERELTAEGPRRCGEIRPRSRTATVNLAESPLTWLHARGHLTDRQLAAGEQLRADYERAQLGPSLTMRWEPVRIAGTADAGLTRGERQIAAKARFDAAMDHAGSDLADILWRMACAGDALVAAEKALDWPARSGKLVLRIALDRVAGFYRLR